MFKNSEILLSFYCFDDVYDSFLSKGKQGVEGGVEGSLLTKRKILSEE